MWVVAYADFWTVEKARPVAPIALCADISVQNAVDFECVFGSSGISSSWTYYSIDLSAYAGLQVYIAIRHDSYDESILVLDDVELFVNDK